MRNLINDGWDVTPSLGKARFLECKVEAHNAFLFWVNAMRSKVLEDMSKEAVECELHVLTVSI